MWNWLRRRRSPLISSSQELIDALYLAADKVERDGNPSAAIEYRASAGALSRATTHADCKGDKEIKDEFNAALFHTGVSFKGQLADLMDISRDTHQLVVSVSHDQQQTGAAVGELRAEFQTVAETVSGLSQDLVTLRDAFVARGEVIDQLQRDVATILTGQNQSVEDRRDLRTNQEHMLERLDKIEAHMAGSKRALVDQHEGRIGDLEAFTAQVRAFIEQIQAYIEPGLTPEAAHERSQRYIDMLERHEREIQALRRDEDRAAGGGQ